MRELSRYEHGGYDAALSIQTVCKRERRLARHKYSVEVMFTSTIPLFSHHVWVASLARQRKGQRRSRSVQKLDQAVFGYDLRKYGMKLFH